MNIDEQVWQRLSKVYVELDDKWIVPLKKSPTKTEDPNTPTPTTKPDDA